MKAFLAQVSERERLLLLLAAVLLSVMLIYALLWRPFDQRLERMNHRVSEQQVLLEWMQVSVSKVERLRSQAGSRRRGARPSILALVDQTVRRSGLSQALKRVEPDGADKVKVRLEQAGFDAMVGWLESLSRINGVMVQSITIDRQDAAGVVNARLTLIGARS